MRSCRECGGDLGAVGNDPDRCTCDPEPTFPLHPMKLIDVCGMAGGCDSQQDAEFELREHGFDPDTVLTPDRAIAQEFLADGAHTSSDVGVANDPHTGF